MFENLLFWLLVVLCSGYVTALLLLWKGFNRLRDPVFSDEIKKISVIIAARNEEATLGETLESLFRQDYPKTSYEVIVANDRSTDATAAIIEKFQLQHSNLRSVTIESNDTDMPNKKNALRTAIAAARYDILAFTDADCIVSEGWLSELSRHFTDDVGAIAGYSPYTKNGDSPFLRYEENKNSLIAAGAAAIGIPFLCTGRNFAYRREVYDSVGGFEKIKHSVSGDDDLFLQLIHRETSWNIRYMSSSKSYVQTLPPSSFSQFYHQRLRHVSASKYYPTPIQFFYAVGHLFHLVVVISFFIAPLIALIFLMVKLNVDGALVARGKELFNEEFSVLQFVRDELSLVAYTFIIGPLGFFTGFEWKGTTKQ